MRPRGRPCPCGCIVASARTRFLPRRRTVKTRPRGKRGCGRTSGRKGLPDGNFPPNSSFMTSLVRMCAKPPPHCPNSDHSQNIISSTRLARQAASSCTLHSTQNLIQKKCSHRWPMGRAMGVSIPRPLERGFKPNSGEEKKLITNIKLWPQTSHQA
jgi:hypothetical protein